MRRRGLTAVLALLLCVCVLSACGSSGEENRPGGFTIGGRKDQQPPDEASFSAGEKQEGTATAAVMVYIVGSNLESGGGAASADIVEMVNSGFDFEHNRLLIITGGSKAWNRSTGISAEEMAIYEVSKRGLNRVSVSPPASMGKPETLTAFLDYCYTNYPAESYGLVLWDHGNGPMAGYGQDELYMDSLSLAELVQALDDSPFGKENKLAFLGFDACLMSSAEVAWSLRDYAQYMIASEEVIPGNGWDYRFLGSLNGAPLDGAQVGRTVVDSYAAYYEERLSGESMLERLTLSCTDLSRAETMEEALDGLFSVMTADLAAGKYSEIARIRQDALPFAKYTTNSDYDLIDLGDLADSLRAEHPEEAAALRRAVDEMVCYAWSPLERAHGLTLYYPFENKKYYSAQWGELYPSFGFAPAYTEFMARFGEEWLGGGSEAWRSGGLPPVEQEEETDEYYIQLSEEQAADYLDGCYYLLREIGEGHYTLCGLRRDLVLDGQNRLHARFGGYSVYVFNNLGESFATLYYDFSETGSHDFHVAATLHTDPMGDGAFRMKNVWFLVSLPHPGDSDPLGVAIERKGDPDQVAYGKEEVFLTDYPCVYFPLFETWESRDEEGRLLPVSQWDRQVSDMFAAYDTSRGWRAELRALGDDGFAYYLQIVARDSYGREYGSELIPVKLTEKGEEQRGEMFQDRFYPLPPREGTPPTLPPLDSLRYFTDSKWYSPIEMDQQLVLDDPAGIRMTLLSGAYRLDTGENPVDLILVFRVDNDSPYFDMFDLETDSDLRIRLGDRMVKVYFLPETLNTWQQRGGSYYYTMSIPLSELPEGAKALPCSFRLWQKEWTTQLNLYYLTEEVEIPLP